jgi:hypothetical protein
MSVKNRNWKYIRRSHKLAGKMRLEPVFSYRRIESQVSIETFVPESRSQDALVFGGQMSMLFGGLYIPINRRRDRVTIMTNKPKSEKGRLVTCRRKTINRMETTN